MGDALATIDELESGGLVCPFPWGNMGPHLTQCRLGRAYLPAKLHLDLPNHLATIHQRYR